LSGSGRTDVGAQSLASQLKEKRSEMIISELEAVALRLFDERGFGEIKGGGHTWPGGRPGVFPVAIVGKTTTSISANEIIWSFFQAHPLTGRIG
jgi:hypothetical protein